MDLPLGCGQRSSFQQKQTGVYKRSSPLTTSKRMPAGWNRSGLVDNQERRATYDPDRLIGWPIEIFGVEHVAQVAQ
jgi:hypothetical protein